MRRFTIDSSLIGTSKHIVGDEEGYALSEVVPRDSWHLTGNIKSTPSAKCLDTLMKLVGIGVPHLPERYISSMRCLVPDFHDVSIPWQYSLPQSEFRLFFNNVVQETKVAFSGLPFDYYEAAWVSGSRVLSSLKTAAVDTEVLQRHVEKVGSAAPGLESFRPKRSGLTNPVVYDRFATRTGRLTVIDGPNILVLKKTCRDILKSTFEGGRVVSLDFKALEARIVLAESGKYSEEEDIYEEISRTQFKSVLPRDVVKVAVLSELYGISRGALKARLGVSEQKLDSFIKVIKEYFAVDELRQLLKNQVSQNGKMLNRFGRPLSIPEGQDNLLVNTYAQSSGVDVAMIGFDAVLKRLGGEGIRPLFVLHDAIIIDVHPDRIEDVRSCTSVEITSYDKPFPLKFELLRDS